MRPGRAQCEANAAAAVVADGRFQRAGGIGIAQRPPCGQVGVEGIEREARGVGQGDEGGNVGGVRDPGPCVDHGREAAGALEGVGGPHRGKGEGLHAAAVGYPFQCPSHRYSLHECPFRACPFRKARSQAVAPHCRGQVPQNHGAARRLSGAAHVHQHGTALRDPLETPRAPQDVDAHLGPARERQLHEARPLHRRGIGHDHEDALHRGRSSVGPGRAARLLPRGNNLFEVGEQRVCRRLLIDQARRRHGAHRIARVREPREAAERPNPGLPHERGHGEVFGRMQSRGGEQDRDGDGRRVRDLPDHGHVRGAQVEVHGRLIETGDLRGHVVEPQGVVGRHIGLGRGLDGGGAHPTADSHADVEEVGVGGLRAPQEARALGNRPPHTARIGEPFIEVGPLPGVPGVRLRGRGVQLVIESGEGFAVLVGGVAFLRCVVREREHGHEQGEDQDEPALRHEPESGGHEHRDDHHHHGKGHSLRRLRGRGQGNRRGRGGVDEAGVRQVRDSLGRGECGVVPSLMHEPQREVANADHAGPLHRRLEGLASIHPQRGGVARALDATLREAQARVARLHVASAQHHVARGVRTYPHLRARQRDVAPPVRPLDEEPIFRGIRRPGGKVGACPTTAPPRRRPRFFQGVRPCDGDIAHLNDGAGQQRACGKQGGRGQDCARLTVRARGPDPKARHARARHSGPLRCPLACLARLSLACLGRPGFAQRAECRGEVAHPGGLIRRDVDRARVRARLALTVPAFGGARAIPGESYVQDRPRRGEPTPLGTGRSP